MMENTLQSVPFLSKVYKHALEPVKIMILTLSTLLLMSTAVLFWAYHAAIINVAILTVGLTINVFLLGLAVLFAKKFTNHITHSLLENLRKGTWTKQRGVLIIKKESRCLRIPITETDYQTMKTYFGK